MTEFDFGKNLKQQLLLLKIRVILFTVAVLLALFSFALVLVHIPTSPMSLIGIIAVGSLFFLGGYYIGEGQLDA